MIDLFDREQEILNQALCYLESTENEEYCDRKMFAKLVKEYERILKLAKRVTWVSDKTTVELNADKMKLLDKVNLDGLTGIYNRQYFDEELKNTIRNCVENQDILGVMMLDVDYFKLFNDTYGHSSGDDCLRKISKVLEDSVPKNFGFAARYGGEEFVIVLPGADETEMCKTAEIILDNINGLKIPHKKNSSKGCVTISIGGVCIEHVSEKDKDKYINCADTALYQSKQSGRDRFTIQIFKEDEK